MAVEPYALAERVAEVARGLDIETALIGATALAVHNYVRATSDIDLATAVDPYTDLTRLRDSLAAQGLSTKLNLPDEDDPLGGLLRVWDRETEDGDPFEPVDVVNFHNPHRARRTPANEAIAHAVPLDEKPSLRYVQLPHLIALKLYAGSRRDVADIVELLKRNPHASRDEIRAVAAPFDSRSELETLFEEAGL